MSKKTILAIALVVLSMITLFKVRINAGVTTTITGDGYIISEIKTRIGDVEFSNFFDNAGNQFSEITNYIGNIEFNQLHDNNGNILNYYEYSY